MVKQRWERITFRTFWMSSSFFDVKGRHGRCPQMKLSATGNVCTTHRFVFYSKRLP
jgi:hypothetical protein